MTAFDAAAVTTNLRGFQRATVAHVMGRFFGPERTRRFLVADETGLGKSLVARGVVAHTIERLLDDDAVGRIDIVYVCSSADLAAQNLRRLDVVGDHSQRVAFSDRLTLLALDAHRLRTPASELAKPVNLISFTPGTSFDPGSNFGRADERALLLILLRDQLQLQGWRWRAARLALQGYAGKSFPWTVEAMERRLEQVGGADPTIVGTFRRSARHEGLIRRFEHLVEGIGRRRSLRDDEQQDARRLVADLRAALAEAGVETLEPDLIILDEFQRFRHLLNPESGPAAELAHQLFDHGDACVLLLSATPYKPFSLAEESAAGDDHFTDLLATLRFLAAGSGVSVDAIAQDLAAFRTAAVTGAPVREIRDRLEGRLLRLMCRTERPQLGADGMLVERADAAEAVHATDLLDYVALRRLADMVDGALTVEYWKSAPYFANFMDGYQLANKVRDVLKDPDAERAHQVRHLLRQTARLERHAVEAFDSVDAANARLRRLFDDTVGAGWWQLLWLPPSLPYLQPDGPWADPALGSVTKRLIFSSWAATPTAAASLLSYEAERRIAEGSRYTEYTTDARRSLATRLSYRMAAGRPAAMTTLALFWPHPTLAAATDPLDLARTNPGALLTSDDTLTSAIELVADVVGGDGRARTTASEAWYWVSPLGIRGGLPIGLEVAAAVDALAGHTGESAEEVDADGDEADNDGEPTRLDAHVHAAFEEVARSSVEGLDRPPDLRATVAALGLHGPGNIAWRALARLHGENDTFTDLGLWTAAAVISAGLRSLFSRHDVQLLLDRSAPPEQPYWRTVLSTCAAGNLQAVLDEYFHHLRHNDFAGPLDDVSLLRLAQTARGALALRPGTYQAADPAHPSRNISFLGRFALRYGSRRGDTTAGDTKRLPEIRNAFNSPFWPFVLATTSVGQEGIDFHWWCHAVFHWNTPASPVDFEQREGRVHRYGGHAIRRNVAHAHRRAILASDGHPWDTAWKVATDRCDELGELAPHWVYPGPHKIERHIAPFPLSRDMARLANLKDDLALYRLAFGQPRQEDLLALLQRRGAHLDPAMVAELHIDLRPPWPSPL